MQTVRASNSFLLPTLRYHVDGQTRVRYAIRDYEALGYAYWMEADSDEPDAPMTRSSLSEGGASLGDLAILLGNAANSARVPLYATEGMPVDTADNVYLIPLEYSAKDGEAWVPAVRYGGCWWIVRDRRTETGWERRRHPLPTALLRRAPLAERMPGRTGKQVLSYSPDAPEPKEVGMDWSHMDALGRRVYRNRTEDAHPPLVPEKQTRPNDAGFSFSQPRSACDRSSNEPAVFKPIQSEGGVPMLLTGTGTTETIMIGSIQDRRVGEGDRNGFITANELVFGPSSKPAFQRPPYESLFGMTCTDPDPDLEGPSGDHGAGNPHAECKAVKCLKGSESDSSDSSDSDDDADADADAEAERRDLPADRPKPAAWAPSTEFRLRRLSLMDGRRTVAKLRTDGWWRVDLDLRPCARIPDSDLAPEDAILRAAFNDE